MQAITVNANGVISATTAYGVKGAILTGTTPTATVQDGAGRELFSLGGGSLSVFLDSPIYVTGLQVANFAGAGKLNIFVE